MKRYRISYDFNKSQPRWSGSLAADFGARNEGVIVEAETASQAFEAFNAPRLPGAQYNSFYLRAVEEE